MEVKFGKLKDTWQFESKINTYNESGCNEKYEVLFNSETLYRDN
jgi:hypothetical protein